MISKASLESVASEYGYSKMEDLHAALGYGKFSRGQVLQKLAPEQVAADTTPAPAPPAPTRQPGEPAADKDLVIKVKGIDDLLVYRAKCCNPIRGEAIVGYVTRGKGVAVHSVKLRQRAKPDVRGRAQDRRRVGPQRIPGFSGKMVIHTADRPGMLNQLTSALLNEQTNIRSLEARGEDQAADGAVIDMTVEVKDKKQLERVVSAIRRNFRSEGH